MNKEISCPICKYEPNILECPDLFENRNFNEWEMQDCPRCFLSTPKGSWKENIQKFDKEAKNENRGILQMKITLERTMIELGFEGFNSEFLDNLNLSLISFQNPRDVGCRILILVSLCYIVEMPDKKEVLINWLKEEKIWNKVSPNELEFLNSSNSSEDQLISISWKIESAYILAWALNLIENPIEINQSNDEIVDAIFNVIPDLGSNTSSFLDNLNFKDKSEIIIEIVKNEYVTSYYRDKMLFGNVEWWIQQNNFNLDKIAQINVLTSFERHYALNWLRKYNGIENWDETDTST